MYLILKFYFCLSNISLVSALANATWNSYKLHAYCLCNRQTKGACAYKAWKLLSIFYCFHSFALASFFLIIAPYLHRHQILSYILVSFKLVVYNFFYSYFYYIFPLLHSPWRVLRWMHTFHRPYASIGFVTHCITSFSTLIQYLLSFFRKACCHSTASASGGCTGKQTSLFVEIVFHIITFVFHFCSPSIHRFLVFGFKG